MSLTVSTDVFCDGDDCRAWIAGVTGNSSQGRAARAQAAFYGWKRRRIDGRLVDLCPECLEGSS